MGVGTIKVDADGCVRLHRGVDGREVDANPIIWPAGTTFDATSGEVRLADGTVLKDGDFVTLGGGFDFFPAIAAVVEPESLTPEAIACVDTSTDDRNVFLLGPNGVLEVNP